MWGVGDGIKHISTCLFIQQVESVIHSDKLPLCSGIPNSSGIPNIRAAPKVLKYVTETTSVFGSTYLE